MPRGSGRVPGRRGRPEAGGRRGAAGSAGHRARSGSARPPAPPRADEDRLAEAIRPLVSGAGLDLESVRVIAAGRRRVLRVIVDGDEGVSLDSAAAVSRQLSALLDGSELMGDFPYTLEVSSPGVDRPLTEPRHWHRARGRLVEVKAAESGIVTGRVTAADDQGVTLDIAGVSTRYLYPVLGPGKVRLEFGHLPEDGDSGASVPGEPGPERPEQGASGDGH